MEANEPNSIIEVEPTIAVFGIFKDNKIITPDGEVIECVTYGRVREQIDEREGFYHLIKYVDRPIWCIYQFILTT